MCYNKGFLICQSTIIVAAVFSSRMSFDSNPYGGCSPTLHFTLLPTLRLKLAICTEQWSRLLNAQFKVVEIVRAPVAVAVVGVLCGVETAMVDHRYGLMI